MIVTSVALCSGAISVFVMTVNVQMYPGTGLPFVVAVFIISILAPRFM